MLKHKKNQEIFSQVKDVELLRELLRRLDDGDVKTEVIFDEKDKSKGDVILVFNNSKEKLSFNLSRLTKDIFEREV
jgi:hypothetical protein